MELLQRKSSGEFITNQVSVYLILASNFPPIYYFSQKSPLMDDSLAEAAYQTMNDNCLFRQPGNS